MPNKKNIKINKILVVGLGLIGASLCRKLKGHSNYEKIIGYDYDDKVMQYAHKNNYVDEICDNLKEGIEESDLVVLSVPVHAIKKILETVKYFFNGNKVFTDTLSTKDSILDFMIDNNLLETNNFILSHPMAGTENFGIKNSEDNLFNNAVTFICPLDFSSLKNIEVVDNMWKSVNSNTSNLDVMNHDRILTVLSHAPHAISFALSKKTNEHALSKEMPWINDKGSLADMIRISNSDPDAWASIFKDNKENILEYLEEYIQELHELKSMISLKNSEDLVSYLKKSNPNKNKLS